MKRLFFLLMLALMTASVWAANTIQDTFMGLKLGQATQSEVNNVLSSQGFELLSDSGGIYVFSGNWKVEGTPIKIVATQYYNDTLTTILFANACKDGCDSLKQQIEADLDKKYGSLQSGDSSLCLAVFSKGIVSAEMEKWSRMDKSTAFMYAKSDSTYMFVYLAEKFMSKQLSDLIDSMQELALNFDEENKITGVAGIKFGENMNTARTILRSRSEEVRTEGDFLYGLNTTVGGVTYDYTFFLFHRENGLLKAALLKKYTASEKKNAELQYDAIVKQYKDKYTNLKLRKNETDTKLYTCGQYTKDYEYPPIYIMFYKGIDSDTGRVVYSISVSYYMRKPDPIYPDEI